MRIFGMIGLLNLIITNEYVIIFKVNVVIPHQSNSRWDIGNGVSVDLDFIFLIFKAFFVEFKSFPFSLKFACNSHDNCISLHRFNFASIFRNEINK